MPKIKDNAVTFLYDGDDLTGEQFIKRMEEEQDPVRLRRIIGVLTLGMEATRAGYQLPGCCIDLEGIPRRPKAPPLESDLGKDGFGKLIEGVDACYCDLIQGSHDTKCGPNCTRKKGSLNVADGTDE